jgi:hypothetical protein
MSFASLNAGNEQKNTLQHIKKSSLFKTPTYAYLNALPTKQDCSEAGSARHIVHQKVDAIKNPPKFSKPNPASQDPEVLSPEADLRPRPLYAYT